MRLGWGLRFVCALALPAGWKPWPTGAGPAERLVFEDVGVVFPFWHAVPADQARGARLGGCGFAL